MDCRSKWSILELSCCSTRSKGWRNTGSHLRANHHLQKESKQQQQQHHGRGRVLPFPLHRRRPQTCLWMYTTSIISRKGTECQTRSCRQATQGTLAWRRHKEENIIIQQLKRPHFEDSNDNHHHKARLFCTVWIQMIIIRCIFKITKVVSFCPGMVQSSSKKLNDSSIDRNYVHYVRLSTFYTIHVQIQTSKPQNRRDTRPQTKHTQPHTMFIS